MSSFVGVIITLLAVIALAASIRVIFNLVNGQEVDVKISMFFFTSAAYVAAATVYGIFNTPLSDNPLQPVIVVLLGVNAITWLIAAIVGWQTRANFQ